MSTITPVSPNSHTTPLENVSTPGSFLDAKNVVTFIFVSTITLLVSYMWGIPLGLLGGSASLLFAVWMNPSLAPPLANLARELNLDPNGEILPDPVFIPSERDRCSFNFARSIDARILQQSLHYNRVGNGDVFQYLFNRFASVAFSRSTILDVKPVRFTHVNHEYEGYEVVVRSEDPAGWIHFCVAKNNDFDPVPARDCNRLIRIPQVTPFLNQPTLEANHFSIMNLPSANIISALQAKLRFDFEDMDLCRIQLQSYRAVRFTMFGEHNGFEMQFLTPNGVVHYYTTNVNFVAGQNEVRNVTALPDAPLL